MLFLPTPGEFDQTALLFMLGVVTGLWRCLYSDKLVVAILHANIDRALSVHPGLLSDSRQLLTVQGRLLF